MKKESIADQIISAKIPYLWWKTTVDAMVRDFTSVAPKTKSQVHGRIVGLIQEVERRERDLINREKKFSHCSQCGMNNPI